MMSLFIIILIEVFLGNQNIHELTNDGYTYLRIEMMDQDCVWKYAEYSTFNVESGSFKYRLNINGYSGNAGIVSLVFSIFSFFSNLILDNRSSSNKAAH